MTEVSGIIPLVSAIVEGLQHHQVIEVVSCVVRIVRELSDSELAISSAQIIFDVATSEQVSQQFQEEALEELTELFRHYCYPVELLDNISSKIELLIKTPNFETFLCFMERLVENLIGEESRWCMLLSEDRDSEVASTDELNWEENNNRYTENEDSAPTSEFEFYLRLLNDVKEEDRLSLIVSHLEKVTKIADGESRHRLALQVILPFIANHITMVSDEGKSEECVSIYLMKSILLIMSELVKQQPTAMALIRNQDAWKQLKKLASTINPLSTAAQKVIKIIVLNSKKFIKIRLSEAEAMKLQDDENDIINFDQRDRNAQGWLFRQFYHVIIQSSVPVINGENCSQDIPHIASCWRIALDLVSALPEFLDYTVERGIMNLGVQLLQALLKTSDTDTNEAESFGSVVQFLVHLIKIKDEMEKFFLREVTPLIEQFMKQDLKVKTMKIVLRKILDSSIEQQRTSQPISLSTCNDDGYEADHSEESDECCQFSVPRKSKIVSHLAFTSFTSGLEQLVKIDDGDTKFLALEYLLYRLSNVELKDPEVNSNLNRGLLGLLLEEIEKACDHDHVETKKLEFVTRHVFGIISSVASMGLSSQTLQKLFSMINQKSSLQPLLFLLISQLITERNYDYELRGISILGPRSRERLSSNLSSDSGFSNLSISSAPLSSSRKLFIKHASEDLDLDYTVVTRIKIEAKQNIDDWIDFLKVENRNETLGVHVNFVKGLKLTLSNSKGTFAAAETNLNSLFRPGKWSHLVLNIGTIKEGSRTTKTLAAFIDCCRVWECGLSVDNKMTAKGRREKFLSLTVGQSANKVGLDMSISDLFILGNSCYNMSDIVKDFVTGSSCLISDQDPRFRLNLRQLGDKLPDLVCYCLPLIEETHESRCSKIVAHFSPGGLWNNKTFDHGVTARTLSQSIIAVGGLSSILMIPAAANELCLNNEVLTTCFDAILKFVTADQERFDLFQKQGGFKIFSYFLNQCEEKSLAELAETCLDNAGYKPPENGFNANSKILLFPELISLLLNVPHVCKFHMKIVLTSLLQFVNEENVYSRFNFSFINSSGLLKLLLRILVNLSKESEVPVAEISLLLSFIPSSQDYIKTLLDCSLLLCPPHLLYLATAQREKQALNEDYFEKIHSDEVVDITSVLNNSLSIATTETENKQRQDSPTNLEYLETTEDVVEEWEVIAGEPETPTSESEISSVSSPKTSFLLSAFLASFVCKMKLLPDAANPDLFDPVLLLPLIAHPSPEVHSSTLQILRLRMERKRTTSYNYEELLLVVSKLVARHRPSSSLVESVLSLVHGHQVNIEIAYEFSITTFSSLNLQTVAIILPSVLQQTYTNVSLCHNLIR